MWLRQCLLPTFYLITSKPARLTAGSGGWRHSFSVLLGALLLLFAPSLLSIFVSSRDPPFPCSSSSSLAPPVSGPCQQTDLVKEERLFAAQWMPCQGPSLPRLLYCVCRGLLTSTRDDTKEEEEEGKGVMAVRTVLQWGRGDGGRQK